MTRILECAQAFGRERIAERFPFGEQERVNASVGQHDNDVFCEHSRLALPRANNIIEPKNHRETYGRAFVGAWFGVGFRVG